MDLHIAAIAQGLFLVACANIAPVLLKKLIGGRCAWPLDFGATLADGRPLFGKSKTLRGIVVAAAASALAAPLVGVGAGVGALTGLASMAGDLASSFVKRRLGVPPSGEARYLDQIPEAVFGLMAAALALPLGPLDIALGALAFLVGQILGSRLFFALGLRDEPH